jgi:transposase InsO family protein
MAKYHDRPVKLSTDTESELISARLDEWYRVQIVTLYWIHPGKPPLNAYIKRFYSSRKLLEMYLFRSLPHVH